MRIAQYAFLKTLDPTQKLYKAMECFGVEYFPEMFSYIDELQEDQIFMADYLLTTMLDNHIYSKYFDFAINRPQNKYLSNRFDFNYYQDIYFKILIMLLGYCEEVYFETTLFDYENPDAMHFGLRLKTAFYTLTDKNYDLFFDLASLALADKGKLYVFFVDLHLIICVNDVRFSGLCFNADDFSFLEKIVSTEGLYIYKAIYE